ncbi:rhomboid family intramembrane serine protease [Thermodesulfobacteriota bacterium]
MIPIRGTIQSRRHPIVTNTIIAANVAFFLVQLTQGAGLQAFIATYGLVPARYTIPYVASYFSMKQQIVALFSFMFLHGGFWHLLGNMWSLHIFGDNVEDRLGHIRFLIFYLVGGWVSGLVHILFNPHSQVPTIGASGAIAGVMGAYFLLYPRSKILTLIPLFFIPYFLEIPAFFFLGLWFVLQFLSAAGSSGQATGIAWWAHIGGFLFGVICLRLFVRRPSRELSRKSAGLTARSKTPRLQIIRAAGTADDPHLYGTIEITPSEAVRGSRKLVNIPWGFHKRMVTVVIPPGMRPGKTLRLRGLGKEAPGHGKGDLYLRVIIQPES